MIGKQTLARQALHVREPGLIRRVQFDRHTLVLLVRPPDPPAVRAGRLAVEVMTWMVPAGNVRFENVPAPRSMAEAAED
jgi:hypothetical protein